MVTKTPVRPTMTDAQLAEVMSLLRGSDTVELKLTVPASQQRDAIRALGLDALDAQIRQVIFFDTPTSHSTGRVSSCARAGFRGVLAIQ